MDFVAKCRGIFLLMCVLYQHEVLIQGQSPIFEKTTYIAEIKEEQFVGFPVIQVQASVTDGSSTTYRLASSVSLFVINQSTGWIYVAGRLDREVSDNQRIYAYAKNTANNIESKVDVVIHLSDINDNAPQISNLPATINLRENVDPGTGVYTVIATDADTSRNALLTYSITNGNQENRFAINSYSGKISSASKLDFESVNDYNISITVKDSGQNITRSNTSVLRIKIQDHDDQPAKFVQERYVANVPENSPKGFSVVRVTAVDMDTAINAPVEYSIYQESNPGFAFSIDKSTGVIRVNNSLDRETIGKYKLRIKASSTIFNPDYATVEISVLDFNDNRPTFLKDRYDATVIESANIATTLLRVTAVDKDAGTNAEFSYAVVGGDAKFSVTTNGDVYLDRKLDRETTQIYQFAIVAFESKTTERYDNSARVYVKVADANDNKPEFQQSVYTVHVTENSPIGTSVIKVQATDKDVGSNAEIIYSLTVDSNDYTPFKIDSKTGDIVTTGALDREQTSSFLLRVLAANIRASNILQSNVTVDIIVDDQNDNHPVFPLPQHNLEVSENIPADTIVFKFIASDPDSGSNGNITYRIVSGDSSKFKIGETSGELCTSVELDREVHSSYDILIEAKDGGGKNGTTRANVKILDVNDNSPQFSSISGYAFLVKEGLSNAFVGQIMATDRDSDLNGNVTYTLNQGEENFAIDSTTGVIRSRKALDYETRSTYVITASAKDRGSPVRSSNTNVLVNVLDANDNKPFFSRRLYYFNVTENAAAAKIGALEATDNDAGTNAALIYRIISGNENKEFLVNSSTGALSTAKTLDREMMELHVLIVSVSDMNGGENSFEDLAAVQIKVMDENDNSPVFDKASISVTINEDSPVGSVIANFKATDVDAGPNKRIRYKVVDGNTNNRFGIDSDSGAVSVRAKVERDPPMNEDKFELSVSAIDMGIAPRSSVAKLFITVTDSNDNKPMFSPEESLVSFKENSPAGSLVFTPNCSDIDSGNNGRISFRLLEVANLGFSIDPFTGAIKTAKVFDYDAGVHNYILQIEASDFGNPQLKSVSKVTVVLTNVNDNSPKFTSTGPFTINEGNYTGRRFKVGQIKAYDNDFGTSMSVYGLISYSFVNMSSYHYDYSWLFDALATDTTIKDKKSNATARLFGARLVSEPRMGNVIKLSGSPNYILIGDFKGDCISNPTLCVHGLSVAMWIKFEAGGYVMSSGAQSNHATGFSLSFESGGFKLRLSTNTKEYQLNINSSPTDWYHFAFTWDEKSGLAYYENGVLLTKEYTVADVAKVTDAYTSLIIGRPNDADGYPQLFGRFYVGELVIWKMKLQDYDVLHAYKNSERKTGTPISHSTLKSSGIFELNRKTGEIFTSVNIDREMTSSFSLDVKASDSDPVAPKYNYTQIVINVLDLNDNAPTFSHGSLNLKVQENIGINSEIVTVKAIDRDEGKNGQLTYSIVFGNTGNTFAIDPSTGKLKNNGAIDREAMSLYTLQVAAIDGGNPPRKSLMMLNIQVIDLNDEFPKFSKTQYTGSIKENLSPGQLVTQVSASDRDLGINGTVRYNISSNFFSINSENGKITTKMSLDRENISKHTIIVTANDGGNPPKQSAVPVIIDVIDENDNSPVFDKASYYAMITENKRVGSSLIQVSAKDPDSGLNGKILYAISGGNDIFSINPDTGLITTADNVDREKYPFGFNIIITCTDSGANVRSASVNLFVNISDANDNAPVFNRFSYRGKVMENDIGAVAVVINATDADTGPAGEIQYSITGGNFDGVFQVDNNGQLKTVKGLDRETNSVYELTVRASDRGGDPRYANVEIDIEVIDTNDNPPVIGDLPDNILISEATLVGSQVVTVVATDRDIGTNGQFSFHGLSTEGKFAIDAKSGAVRTSALFDYEERSRYTFVVGVTDHGSPPLNSTTVTINFTIVDSNDNNPVFTPSTYFATVKENSAVGTHVVSVNASESDTSSAIGYQITNGNHGNRFTINSVSGAITVNGKLDREDVAIYYLLITASDNGLPPRLGQAYVTVSVADENDLPPKFQFKDYRGEVTENVPVGTSVLTITAKDPDLSNSTQLKFRIFDGNIGNAFLISTHQSINEFKGIIKTAGAINREALDLYQLKVSVYDGIFTEIVNVTIKVADVNDNFPIFNSSIYVAETYENEAAGKLVIQISATDADEGQNAMIRYGIENSNGLLFIDRFTGEITTTTKTLDRESANIYDILCSAQDSGGRKAFLLKRELEKEREKSNLAAKKLVSKQLKCKILQKHFAKSIADCFAIDKEAIGQSCSELGAVEITMKQLGEDNRLLKNNIEHLINNEGNLRRDLERLKGQNEELKARKISEFFTNDLIIESLQARFKEEEALKTNEIEKLQTQVEELHDMQNRALSAEKKTSEQANLIDQQEKKLSEAEDLMKIHDEDRNKLKHELDIMRTKIREKDVLLAELDEQLSEVSVGIKQLSDDLKHWQSEAGRLKEDVKLKEKKISSLEKERKEIETEFTDMTKIKKKETRIFAVEVASLKLGIDVSEKEKSDLSKKIELLENENSILAEKVDALTAEGERHNLLKVKQEENVFDLQEKNKELNEMIAELTQSSRKLKKKPWWRKLVSCS